MVKVNKNEANWQKGMTVNDLIRLFNYTYPVLFIKVNGKYIPKEMYDRTLVNDGDNVDIIHPVCGG